MLQDLLPHSAFSFRRNPLRLWIVNVLVALLMAACGLVPQGWSQTAHFGSAQRTVIQGLFSPFGLAADAAGSLYVTDSGNNRVVTYVPLAGTYTQSAVFDATILCGSATPCGVNTPYGVAVDAAGDVFIADLGNNRVVKETLSGGTYTQSTVASTNSPNAVAVDSNGNVYIADTGSNQVLVEMPVAGGVYALSATISGLNSPKGVAVDAGGNVYVADTGNNRVLKETPGTGGFYFATTVATTSAAYDVPFGVAVDAGGNVFYDDYNTGASTHRIMRATLSGGTYSLAAVTGDGTVPFVYGMAADRAGNVFLAAGGVVQLQLSGANFFSQAVGGMSAFQTLSFVFDTGGTLGSDAVLTQGATGLDFADAAGGSCRNGTAYNAGSTCTVSVTFTPRFPGVRQGAVTLKNNSGTVIATAYITGVGVGPQVAFTPGTLSTVAGNGTQCPVSTAVCGDGGAATGANLFNPAGVTADAAGILYIADADDNRIRKVTPGGLISTVAGTGATGGSIGDGGPATGAQLYYPNGVAIDGAGNLYAADTFNHRVRRVDAATGLITTTAGTGTPGSSGDGGPAVSAMLHDPYGVALDGFGNVYIADTFNDEIRKVSAASGIITTVAGTHNQGFNGDGGPATSANLYLPHDVTLDSGGNLFIADTSDHRIRRVDAASGIITTVAGKGSGGFTGDGGVATGAELYNPRGVALDGAGNLYIGDQGNERIRKVSITSGIIATVVGTGADTSAGDGGSATSGTVAAPGGVALDATGNLYIADYDTHRIRRISAASNPLTFANTAIGNTSPDSPQTVTLNNTGNASLTLESPATNGNLNPSVSAGFRYGSTSTCPQLSPISTSYSLAAGASCTELISFAPQTAGTYGGSVTSTDDALNAVGSTQTVSLAGIAKPATPTIAVTNSSTTFGTASVTLTAAITFGGVADTGAVTFAIDNGMTVAGSCVSAGMYTESCTVSYNTASLTAGSHTITASVAADTNYLAAATTGALTVAKATHPLTVAGSPSAVYGSSSASLSASVTYTGTAAPNGTLNFTVDSGTAVAAICMGTVSPLSCNANYPLMSLGVGSHVITVTEGADMNYNAATAMGTLNITQATPTVTPSPLSIVYGTPPATLLATLSYAGVAAPSGGLSFTVDGGTPVAATCIGTTSPLVCSAAYNTASLTSGSHTLRATEAADTNYNLALGGPVTLTVTSAAPGLTLGTTSISYGTATATLTATVAYGGAAAPSGPLTFAVDTIASRTATCTGTSSPLRCTVSYPSANLTAGTHTVVASLAADTNYTAVSITAASLTVTRATPVITWPQPAPISYGMALSNAQLDATANVPGTFVYSPTPGAVPQTGTPTLTATFTPNDTTNYIIATKTVSLTVTSDKVPVCILGSIQAASAMTNPTNGIASYVFAAAGSCTDPQGQPLTASIDWGDGSVQSVPANGSYSHPYANPPAARTYSVVLAATDMSGLVGTATQSVIVVPAPTLAPGTFSTVAATIAPQPSIVGPGKIIVSFTCSSVLAPGSTVPSLPDRYGITCVSPPQTIDPAASAQANVTINTTAGTTSLASNASPGGPLVWFALCFPFPGMAFLTLGTLTPTRARRRRGMQSLGLLLLLCSTLIACGGSFTPPSTVATPPGSYAITITEVAYCPATTAGTVCPALPTGFVQTSLIVPLTIKP